MLKFTAAGAVVGAVWGLVQTIETFWHMSLKVRKLRAEVKSLNERTRWLVPPLVQVPSEPLAHIQELDKEHVADTVLCRLEKSEVKISQADVDPRDGSDRGQELVVFQGF
ncbi:hypothetical protein JQX13_09080 [Archangium violaceum]|uniref:hypothetical protein n=1 Tax=Archangium violaceum TaxID=83451 RepID=UPI00193C04AD|nr:hypothetical protein [Archangium violaceum]QRK10225.1 hypothetical protein JQX13_09080 [Archangium violaceum]